MTAMDASRVLFTRPLDLRATGAGIAETLAHLNRLLRAGKLERWTESDGAYLYRAL
jgi:hypothetical protein